ncbi:MAG: hypothetical protein UY40_C0010G0015 [candidate division CPR1 bacterium GW2011_GWC1_49_13]|uniref:Uncharacterized protein n=1 Tax=candidate division CPR1 bacterium GW2011_GWC1_49_13 TaxID=1618342 RepID=A0A0G1VGP2_9BACT|nr:MAG: hypothetical protein UY40_C0010G0015 [candidate division CPR1 bacterium GW2011_GWC1_49_13]
MLFRMAHDELTERELLNKLQQKIKDYIDGGKLTSLEEFTFEIEDGEFFETKNPRWWNKTLRLMYG